MREFGGLRLFSIASIDVAVDWSLLIIFFLITFSLASGVFPAWHPDWSWVLSWTTAFAAAVLFFASVLAHELSHALVGRATGVEVRRITLFIFGGVAHMEDEPPSWRSELAMAIAGPLASLALGLGFLWLAATVSGPIDFNPDDPQAALAGLGPVPTLLLWLGPINILLALFNLVPGFPLDGGRVLRAVLWGITGDLHAATRWASYAGRGFAWLLIGSGFVMFLGGRVPILGGGLVNGLWLALIGWFLNNAALAGYRQLQVRESLADVPVTKLMQSRVTRVDPDLPLDVLVDEHVMASGQRSFPVVADGRFVGMVSLRDLHKRERSRWNVTTVGDVMTPLQAVVTVGAEQTAAEAASIIGRRDLNQLPVVSGGELVGLLRREDILKWLSLHADQRHEGRGGRIPHRV